jgi:hypothetical protein
MSDVQQAVPVAGEVVENAAKALYYAYAQHPEARWDAVDPAMQENVWRAHIRAVQAGDIPVVPPAISPARLTEPARKADRLGEGGDLAVWCAREAEARRAEENSSPHTAKLTREGRYDDQGVMPVAIAAARIALGLTATDPTHTREGEGVQLIVVTDPKGFITLHEPDEDSKPGDLVASVWRDDWLDRFAHLTGAA